MFLNSLWQAIGYCNSLNRGKYPTLFGSQNKLLQTSKNQKSQLCEARCFSKVADRYASIPVA
jgi:hypothetical protein